MRFTSHTLLDGGVLEREFTLAGFTGILWMPPTATPSSQVPLLLLNQPGGFDTRRMYPRLVARAAAAAKEGFGSVTIELARPYPAPTRLAPTCAPRSPRARSRAPR
ncbi:hypothetical protein [Microbacterium sp. SCN 71-17]|uniref:hypothetical protein n=1 Tax=Microbacterium sp. SCN 71-17 TaxID=1660111 RepID=UPI0025D4CFBD|nr:hypothetical protein [Microbacterium sp. SCN 71-17]